MATGNCSQQVPSNKSMYLYDTTLRDGSQRKGLSFSLDDKLKITKYLDELGVPYIEGGWPDQTRRIWNISCACGRIRRKIQRLSHLEAPDA